MDVGCGTGLFTIPMTQMVGDRPRGKLLVAEPKIHVPGKAFQQTVATAEAIGFRLAEEPRVRWCRAVVLATV